MCSFCGVKCMYDNGIREHDLPEGYIFESSAPLGNAIAPEEPPGWFLTKEAKVEIITDLTWPIPKPRPAWLNSQPWLFGEHGDNIWVDSSELSDQWVGPEHGEVLFTEAGWHISKNPPGGWDINANTDSVMWHYCASNGGRVYADTGQAIELGTCPVCAEHIPESVMTLWKLQNMDHLPLVDHVAPWDIVPELYESSGPEAAYYDEDLWEAAMESADD